MEIVIENPAVETRPGLSIVTTAVTPTPGVAFTCCDSMNAAQITTAAIVRPIVSESDLVRSPTCFPCRREYNANSAILLAQSHYPRQRGDRYPLTSYDDPGGFTPPSLARQADRSGLPVGASAYEPTPYFGSHPFNGGAHLSPLRVDASGLLGRMREPDKRSPCTAGDFEADASEMTFLTPVTTTTTTATATTIAISENQAKSTKIMVAARMNELEGRCMETNVDQEQRKFVTSVIADVPPVSPLFPRTSPFQFRESPVTVTDANTTVQQNIAEMSCTSTAITTTTTITSTTTTTTMTMKADGATVSESLWPENRNTRSVISSEAGGGGGGDDVDGDERNRIGNGENFPEEERAEAEGCEHRGTDDFTENGVSPKGSNVFLDNDAIQTLRVIILSEQL